jgi:hypothetical protein
VRGSVIARILAALVVTCLAAVGFYWVFLRHDKPEGADAEVDFARIHENTSPPDRFDTGQTAIISNNPTDSGSNFVVRDGKLTYDPTKEGPAGAAYSTDMRAPITRIGARWVFEPRAGNPNPFGAVSLSISQSVQPEAPWVVPPIPIQFIVTPVNWHLALQKDWASPRVDIAAEPFKEPLKVDGTTASEVDVTIDEGSVNIKLPDGSMRHYRDARISQWKGNYASFGLYSNNGLTDSIGGFEKIWAAAGSAG